MDVTDLIRRHEGLRLRPYHCTANRLTIGYGRNLEDRGITEEEAEYLLENDLKAIREELVDNIDSWAQLSDVRQAVLIDMTYKP